MPAGRSALTPLIRVSHNGAKGGAGVLIEREALMRRYAPISSSSLESLATRAR